MMLELIASPSALFVTLTYANHSLPAPCYSSESEEGFPEPGSSILVKSDLVLFLKRLRFYLGHPFRYYAVGEYGDEGWRAHYHLILYGVDFVERDKIEKAWLKKGGVHVGLAEPASMQYVAGYVIKKLTSKKSLKLKGRPPEFALMSRRPGIGMIGMDRFAAAISKNPAVVASLMDGSYLPTVFQVEAKKWPLDRYLKSKLYPKIGVSKEMERRFFYDNVVVKDWALRMTVNPNELDRRRKARLIAEESRMNLERRRLL